MKLQDVRTHLAEGKGTLEDIKRVYSKFCVDTALPFHPDIALKAAHFGYFAWPNKIRHYYDGKDVLDVGCGSGIDGIGFVTLGARSYIGIDPGIDLDRDLVKHNTGAKQKNGSPVKVPFGYTPRQISQAFSNISYFSGSFEDLELYRNYQGFDIISMNTVTEHLLNIEEVFEGCGRLLRSGGLLIFMHDNYYSWNGHHMGPVGVEHLDPEDEEQQKYIDWRHIRFDPPEGHYILKGLNRIRLDDLRSLTERHFNVQVWTERDDKPERVSRLTPEIRDSLKEYSLRELTTNKVFCVAK